MTETRAVIKRLLFQLIGAVVVLDLVAIGLYQATGVERMEPRTRMYVTFAWTLATLVVVLYFLRRIRAARDEARRTRRQT
jgi:hypothetical protein